MDAAHQFDEAARGVEVRLAELRRLLAGLELTGEQQERIALLLPTLSDLGEMILSVRNELLGAPDGPTFGYERLPEGFTPTDWTTETYVTPVTSAWGKEFAPKPGGEITVDSLFEGDKGPGNP
jgi:hypothetical protein